FPSSSTLSPVFLASASTDGCQSTLPASGPPTIAIRSASGASVRLSRNNPPMSPLAWAALRLPFGQRAGRGRQSDQSLAEFARPSCGAGLLEDQEPVGSVRRLLCQSNRRARTVAVLPIACNAAGKSE